MFPELTSDEVFMIGTQRLWLRWPLKQDADDLARLSGDVGVATSSGSWPVGSTAAYASERIARMRAANTDGTGLVLVVARRGAWTTPIGMIGAEVVAGSEGAVAAVGYHLAAEHWNQGYIGEALDGLITQIRLLTRIARLNASVVPDNAASAAVLVKNGFRKTGSSSAATPARGKVELDHYARDLRLIGADASRPNRRVVGDPGATIAGACA